MNVDKSNTLYYDAVIKLQFITNLYLTIVFHVFIVDILLFIDIRLLLVFDNNKLIKY